MNEIRVPQERIAQVRGRVGLWNIRESGLIEPIGFKRNQIQYSWGYIAAQCMGRAAREYAIRYMYIEYKNVAAPGDSVDIPEFGRDEGVDYYEQLYLTSDCDYLRVLMIVEPMISIATGFEDYFTGEAGNKLTFFSQTQAAGSEGLAHALEFGNSVNSKVYGAALVAAPGGSDRSQDVIFARTYFVEEEQCIKEVSSQLGITWEVIFA